MNFILISVIVFVILIVIVLILLSFTLQKYKINEWLIPIVSEFDSETIGWHMFYEGLEKDPAVFILDGEFIRDGYDRYVIGNNVSGHVASLTVASETVAYNYLYLIGFGKIKVGNFFDLYDDGMFERINLLAFEPSRLLAVYDNLVVLSDADFKTYSTYTDEELEAPKTIEDKTKLQLFYFLIE